MKSLSTSSIREFVTPIFTPGKVHFNPSSNIVLIVGDWPLDTKKNLVGGHEGAGIAVAVGSSVKSVAVGDHVGIKV